jgi:hypothetical protein
MDASAPIATATPLARFEALVMADEGLQHRLAGFEDENDFAAAALEIAAAGGIALETEDLAHPSPAPLRRAWPGRGWLPIALVHLSGGGFAVEWSHFSGARLAEPFFADSAQRARARPFNRLFRWRTALRDFVASAPAGVRPPDGFVLHLSRCGSTLVARMLASLPGSVAVSEAPPVDAIVQLALAGYGSAEEHVEVLRAMVAAFGRARPDDAAPFFLKLDSWHALALPLLRAAFPAVPWVFLYRDPVEILVSQMRLRGTQMQPPLHNPRYYGIDNGFELPGEEYCALVLKRVAESAIDGLALGGGMLVDYAELPDAVTARILPHFGIAPAAEGEKAMAAVARRDAKAPHAAFAADGATKQGEASAKVRAATGRHLAGVHARLQALRGAEALQCA